MRTSGLMVAAIGTGISVTCLVGAATEVTALALYSGGTAFFLLLWVTLLVEAVIG